MRERKKTHWAYSFFGILVFALLLFGNNALAADTAGNWRTIYDPIMRWLNFGILLFVFIKYLKTPIKDFLEKQKEEINKEIERITSEKELAENRIKEIEKELEQSPERFSELKARIIKQGEKKKQQIIEKAQIQSRLMMEEAANKVDHMFHEAKLLYRSELIDAAVNLVIERIPKVITEEDRKNIEDQYLASMSTK